MIGILVFTISLHASAQKKIFDIKKVDKTHDVIKAEWKGLNENFDAFFASTIDEDEINESYIRMNLISELVDGEGASTEYNLRMQTDFPNTSKDVKLVIKKESDDIFDDGKQASGVATGDSRKIAQGQNLSDALEDTRYSAAGRFILFKRLGWRVYSDLGMRFDLPIDPFLKLRMRKRYRKKDSRLDLIQKIEYFRINELSHETIVKYLHRINRKYRFRQTNSFSYFRLEHFYRFYNSFSILHRYKRKTSFTYDFTPSGLSEPVYHYNNYAVSTTMRRLIYKDWLYLNVTLGFNFPKEVDFDPRGFVIGTFDALF